MIEELIMYDAHCHPTEVPSQLDQIPKMKTRRMICMSTNTRDIEKVAKIATDYQDRVIPAFGFHPWFVYQLYDDTVPNFSYKEFNKVDHYKSVIVPSPAPEFINELPEPISLSKVLNTIEEYLIKFPTAIVGECGLDKAFRLPIPSTMNKKTDDMEEARSSRVLSSYRTDMHHQTVVLKKQLEIAAKYQRPVSLHVVQSPGLMYDMVQEGFGGEWSDYEKRWPPSICLHSYSGTSDFLKSTWYKPLSKRQLKAQASLSKEAEKGATLPRIFVSCSILLNHRTLQELTSIIPKDMLLLESDFHKAGEEMDELNSKVLLKASECLGVTPSQLGKRIESNFNDFLNI